MSAARQGPTVYEAQNEFAKAHNQWTIFADTISPSAPDFKQQLRDEWLKREVGEKFRRLERSLE